MLEYDAAVQQMKEARKEEGLSPKIFQELVSNDKSVDVQSTENQVNKIIYNNVEKQHIFSYPNDRINKKKFGDFLTRKTNVDPIIKVT